MNCPNYNNSTNSKDMYCTNCGKKMKEHTSYFNHAQISSEDYLKTYIGKNYKTIKKEKLSIPAFILGPFYLLYRKLWLSALLIFLINIIFSKYTNGEITLFIQLSIEIFLGIKINDIIINTAKKNIDEIKISNSEKTPQEILSICQTKGGTSKMLPTLSTIIIIAAIALATSSKPSKQLNNNLIKSIDNLTYKIPNNIESSKYNDSRYQSYTYNTKESNCTFTLLINKHSKIYNTIDDYFEKNISPENTTKLPTTLLTRNNITWEYKSFNKKNITENYYITLLNNKFFILESKIYKDINYKCNNLEKSILESIKIENNK